jgi:uncharacterized protein YjbI with pentapeptide repeats
MKINKDRWLSEEFRSQHMKALEEVFIQLKTEKPYDLRGLSVGVEGPLKTLWNANLHRAEIAKVDFGYSIFSCSFSNGRFTGVKFDSVFFDACTIYEAKFEGCRFVNAKMIVNLDDSVFDRCDFSLVQFKGRRSLEYGGRRVTFANSTFSSANFQGIEIRASKFINCSFEGCIFNRCDLRGVKFEGNAPTIGQFKDSNLRGATINRQAIVSK